MTPPVGPSTRPELHPKLVMHGTPLLPRLPNGKMPECAGSRMPVTDPSTITDGGPVRSPLTPIVKVRQARTRQPTETGR